MKIKGDSKSNWISILLTFFLIIISILDMIFEISIFGFEKISEFGSALIFLNFVLMSLKISRNLKIFAGTYSILAFILFFLIGEKPWESILLLSQILICFFVLLSSWLSKSFKNSS